MQTAIGRRKFFRNGLLFTGAALLLSRGAARAAASAAATGSASGSSAGVDCRVLRFLRQYSADVMVHAAATEQSGVTRITARVRDCATMHRALAQARPAGIGRIRASGNTIAFALDGRRYEVEHRAHVA